MRILLLVAFSFLALVCIAQDAVKAKSAFSLSIRAHDREVASGHRIELQIMKTNLSDAVLFVGSNRIAAYTFDVRRNGVLLPETEQAKDLREHPLPDPMIDGNLPPHGTAVDVAAVNEFRDMREPGVYAIEVQEGSVKSNTVTVTVKP
jgi:hypothetical protein